MYYLFMTSQPFTSEELFLSYCYVQSTFEYNWNKVSKDVMNALELSDFFCV